MEQSATQLRVVVHEVICGAWVHADTGWDVSELGNVEALLNTGVGGVLAEEGGAGWAD